MIHRLSLMVLSLAISQRSRLRFRAIWRIERTTNDITLSKVRRSRWQLRCLCFGLALVFLREWGRRC